MIDVTARPWRTDELEHDSPYEPIEIIGENGDIVCRFWIDDAPVPDYNRRQRANACHIVQCVNNHERLVEMLERIVDGDRGVNAMYEARTLIAALEDEKGGEL